LVTLEGDSVVMNLQTARALLKNGKQVIVKGKKLNRNLEYIHDLPVVMKNPMGKCKADSKEFFQSVPNLIEVLKQNALLGIANCLNLFSLPKYKKYKNWEKFNQAFQFDLIKMSTSHTYYIAAKMAW